VKIKIILVGLTVLSVNCLHAMSSQPVTRYMIDASPRMFVKLAVGNDKDGDKRIYYRSTGDSMSSGSAYILPNLWTRTTGEVCGQPSSLGRRTIMKEAHPVTELCMDENLDFWRHSVDKAVEKVLQTNQRAVKELYDHMKQYFTKNQNYAKDFQVDDQDQPRQYLVVSLFKGSLDFDDVVTSYRLSALMNEENHSFPQVRAFDAVRKAAAALPPLQMSCAENTAIDRTGMLPKIELPVVKNTISLGDYLTL